MPMEIQQTLNDKAQARREGGQFLILSPQEGLAAALSALPLDLSAGEVTNNSSPLQENGELFRFEEDAVNTAYTFTSAAEAIDIETQKSPQGSWKTIQKRILVPRLRTLMQIYNY